MPNPWVIAALAGFSVVAFFVYLSELDQPPLAPPHYQHASSGGSNQSNHTSARDANNGNSKKNDGDDDDGKSDSERDKGDRTAEQATAATVTTSSGAHRFPGSVGSGSMMVRRRSRTISAGSRQESPTTTPERSSPPPPAYTPTLPSTSHLSEPPIELQPLHSSPPAATTPASSHDHQEALALASELEDTERQLQALLVKREQLALRQSQIDLRELAAQAAAAAQQTSPPSPPTSSTTSGLFDAPSPFAASPGDQEDGGMTELDKMRDTSVVLESEPGSSSVSESLVSVPPVQVSADHASAENEPVSPSTSGFDSLTSRSEATSDDGKGDLTAVVETTATAAGEDEPEADARSESEYSLVSAGSA